MDVRLACENDEILDKSSVFKADEVPVIVEDGNESANGKQANAFQPAIDYSDAEIDKGFIFVCLHAEDSYALDFAWLLVGMLAKGSEVEEQELKQLTDGLFL